MNNPTQPTSPFSSVPYGPPPKGATFNGVPLPRSAGYFFISYGGATEILQEVQAAILAAGGKLGPLPEEPGVTPLAVVDGILDGEFGQFYLPVGPTTPYLPTMVGLWTIKGNFVMPQGLCYQDDIAGLLEKRSTAPNQPTAMGDKNLVQVGTGGAAVMVGEPTTIAIQVTTGNLAQAYWAAPSA